MPGVTVTEEFAELAKALYGDVDVEALWDVAKMSPDPSSVHVLGATGRKKRVVAKRKATTPEERRAQVQRRVAVGSNALGLTAGAAAIGSTLRDDRLLEGGKFSRKLYATGEKIPKPIANRVARMGPRGKAAAAAGAVLLQGANVVGDGVVSQTLPKEKTSKALEDVEKISIKALTSGRLIGLRRQSQVALNPTAGMSEVQQARVSRKAAAGKAKVGPAVQQIRSQQSTRKLGRQLATAPNAVMNAGGDVSARVAELRAARATRVAASNPGAPLPARPNAAQRLEMKFAQRQADGGTTGTVTPRRVEPNAPAAAPPPPAPAAPAQRQGMLSTPGGRTAAGAAALAGTGFYAGNRRGKRSAYAEVAPYAQYSVGKADAINDVAFEGTFSKFDDDKRLAFGWASVVALNGEPVVDRQGDYIAIGDIEEAAYVYVEKSRVGGDMHRRAAGNLGSELGKTEDRPHKVGELVESMVFTPEKISKMGLPADFPVGWWVGYKIHDDDAWAEVKKGNRTGFSIHGKGLRKEVDYDSILEAA